MKRTIASLCFAAVLGACGDNHAAAPSAEPEAQSAAAAAAAAPSWKTLPVAAVLPEPWKRGPLPIDGAQIYFTTYGDRDPTVLMLHGGLASSEYWGNQVEPLREKGYRVVLVDGRGHGRSSRGEKPLSYALLTSDLATLMNRLLLQKVSVVGWGEGAIVGLELALRHPERVARVFAFGANSDPSGRRPDAEKNPTVARFVADARGVYQNVSPSPDGFDALRAEVAKLRDTEPRFSAEQLGSIRVPVTIADGEHEEAIALAHTQALARAIPGAKLLILPGVSQFAMLQEPRQFNTALFQFLGAP